MRSMHTLAGSLAAAPLAALLACAPEPPAARTAGTAPDDAGSADAGARAEDAGEPEVDAGADEPEVDAGEVLEVDAGPSAFVRFVSPAHEATVDNPVRFVVEASGVDEVQVFADETFALAPPFDPSAQDTVLYRFGGTGFPRDLHVEGRVDGVVVARQDLTITVAPDSCEELFFVAEFAEHNVDDTGALDLASLREDALAQIEGAVAELQACGAGVTLGGMLSLLLYEGAFRVAAFNTICEENSYNNTVSNCDADPEAYYSYQFGLGAIHTSNFHPCRGGAYTQGMRQAFLQALAAEGFASGADLVTPTQAARFAQVCPNATPSAVDHYILGAHDVFDIPRDGRGNLLSAYGAFPFFAPRFSIELSFKEILAQCASIDDDRDAIRVFGGGDARYGTVERQNDILSLYAGFAASCP